MRKGERLLPVKVAGQEPPSSRRPGLYASASLVEKSGEIILKVVNSAAEPAPAVIKLEGLKGAINEGTEIVLAGSRLGNENSFDEPRKVAPVSSSMGSVSAEFPCTFRPWSVTVLRLRGRR